MPKLYHYHSILWRPAFILWPLGIFGDKSPFWVKFYSSSMSKPPSINPISSNRLYNHLARWLLDSFMYPPLTLLHRGIKPGKIITPVAVLAAAHLYRTDNDFHLSASEEYVWFEYLRLQKICPLLGWLYPNCSRAPGVQDPGTCPMSSEWMMIEWMRHHHLIADYVRHQNSWNRHWYLRCRCRNAASSCSKYSPSQSSQASCSDRSSHQCWRYPWDNHVILHYNQHRTSTIWFMSF